MPDAEALRRHNLGDPRDPRTVMVEVSTPESTAQKLLDVMPANDVRRLAELLVEGSSP